MNLIKSKLGATLLLAASASMAQAATYNVSAVFEDGGMQGQTVFNGSFDWTGATVSNFSGLLSESMYGWNGGGFDGTGTASGGGATKNPATVYAKPGGYADNEAPLLNLTHQLASNTSGNLVTVTTFLNPNTNVVSGGGYDLRVSEQTNGTQNAFFTLVFDSTNITSALANSMVYGDFTALGLMSTTGMTGYFPGSFGVDVDGNPRAGTMGGVPFSLNIAMAPPTAVPLPAAAWLFGGALLSLFGANRRKHVLPA